MTPKQIQYLQLVTNHQALLQGYIHSIAPGVEADDVLQETNIILWNKMETFEMGTNFKKNTPLHEARNHQTHR